MSEPPARSPSAHYRAQHAYVAAMFDLLGRLIAASSVVDPVVRAELEGFPEGCTIGFSILGATPVLRVRVAGGRLLRAPGLTGSPDLEIVFKHLSLAFALLSFRESTAIAYARGRLSTHGDVALTMRFVRCLDRVQGVMLPGFLAARALKSLPAVPFSTRLGLGARIAGGVVKGLVQRSSP